MPLSGIFSDQYEIASKLVNGGKKSLTDVKRRVAIENDDESDDSRASPQTARRTEETTDESMAKIRATDARHAITVGLGCLSLADESDDDETIRPQRTKSTRCTKETRGSLGLFVSLQLRSLKPKTTANLYLSSLMYMAVI